MNSLPTLHRILFLVKPDPEIYSKARNAVSHLCNKSVEVVVEEKMLPHLHNNPDISCLLHAFDPSDRSIDLIILFGGDGLLLHCGTLFQNRCIPPVIFFDFGSFGFLSPFHYEEFNFEV